MKQEVTQDDVRRMQNLPEWNGRDHLWIVTTAYRVDPTKWNVNTEVHMDKENLLIISPPGCLYCEQMYEQRLAYRNCPGEPKE